MTLLISAAVIFIYSFSLSHVHSSLVLPASHERMRHSGSVGGACSLPTTAIEACVSLLKYCCATRTKSSRLTLNNWSRRLNHQPTTPCCYQQRAYTHARARSGNEVVPLAHFVGDASREELLASA